MFLAPLLTGFCLQKRSGIRLIYPLPKKERRPTLTKSADTPSESDQTCPSLQITIIVRDESTAQSSGIPPTT